MIKRADGAIQETSGSARAAATLIGVYVAARSVEKILGAFAASGVSAGR
jgi:hypothetical protein